MTLSQTFAFVAGPAVAWLMIRLGESKGRLVARQPGRCAACGRRLTQRTCDCTRA
jgi:hypothetical protein